MAEEEKKGPVAIVLRGAYLGLAYATAVTVVTLMNTELMKAFRLGIPPMTQGAIHAGFLTILIGLPLGLILSLLLRAPWGKFLHLIALTVVWTVLEYNLALDSPLVRVISTVGGGVAFVVVLIGWLIGRKWRFAPPILAAILLIAALAIPEIYAAVKWSETTTETALSPAVEGAPDVMIVVLDTVRAQNVSAYGYKRKTTPYFDRLAEEGALFLDATAPSTWSLPSHGSLFTGLFPSVHGTHAEHRYLDEGHKTLAQVLAEAGYETSCFTANPHISSTFGLTRGFQYSDRSWSVAAGGRSFYFAFRLLDRLGLGTSDKGGAMVATNFEKWVEDYQPERPPQFVFINFLEAHFPYHQTPKEFLNRFTDLPKKELQEHSLALLGQTFGGPMTDPAVTGPPAMAMYDAGILYSDHLLSRVVQALRNNGMLDNTVLIVLADHGELLGEHGDSLAMPFRFTNT